ncbi:TPA: hypothetical protein N6020_005311, partial [Escherichia coli]|nr:hypothetical protein [Escherichia coli]
TITSGGNPPAFSLTPDGRLTAKNADISGNVNANSGTLNNVTINENCRVLGKLSANQIEGDIVKTVGKAFPRTGQYGINKANGTIRVIISDDQPFDRQIIIPPIIFAGAQVVIGGNGANGSESYLTLYCRLTVRKNGVTIYDAKAGDNTQVYSDILDMPAGRGHMQLEFSVVSDVDEYPAAPVSGMIVKAISDLQVIVVKKSTAGISIS